MLTAEHAETAEKPPRKSNPVAQAFQPVHNAGRDGPPTTQRHGAGTHPTHNPGPVAQAFQPVHP